MHIKQKRVFDAGVDSTINIPNQVAYLDPTDPEVAAPKSRYSISENGTYPFTNHIVGYNSLNVDIADGERRPGHK
jgi:hypothetical protein